MLLGFKGIRNRYSIHWHNSFHSMKTLGSAGALLRILSDCQMQVYA